MELTQKQKDFITLKQVEYERNMNQLKKLENEVSLLYIERRIKTNEYEEAKRILKLLNKDIEDDQAYLSNMMTKYVTKKEIKYIFSTMGKAFAVITIISLVSVFIRKINIIDISNFVVYFIASPLLGSAASVMLAYLFSDKKRRQFTMDFQNLEETKRMNQVIDEKIENAKEKKQIFDEKNKIMKDSNYHVEQLEHKIKSIKYELDKIKTSIVETICSTECNSIMESEIPHSYLENELVEEQKIPVLTKKLTPQKNNESK